MRFSRRIGLLFLSAFILLLELGCGNEYRPVANPIIGPGGQPQSLHYAYVVNYNASGNGSNTQIDVSGDSVTFSDFGAGGTFSNLNPENTGTDGTASQFYTLPATPGSVTITGTATGVVPSAAFTETAQ